MPFPLEKIEQNWMETIIANDCQMPQDHMEVICGFNDYWKKSLADPFKIAPFQRVLQREMNSSLGLW